MMKKVLIALGVLMFPAFVLASAASADGGPHGDYRTTAPLTDKCAGCHRVHQGESNGKLLRAATPYALCLTCHNGEGSRLDVLDGVRLAAATTPRVPGQAGEGSLNGGGFEYISGVAVTSKHNADPADNSTNPWGYSTANTGQNTQSMGYPLQCTSCHNPHGSTNYRILRTTVNGQAVDVKAWFSAAYTANEGANGFGAGAPADKYTKEYYGSLGDGSGAPSPSLASLCGACHTSYPSAGATVALTTGGVTHYRHRTEMPYTNWTNPNTGAPPSNPETAGLAGFPALRLASNGTQDNTIVTCLTCHRVHGSTAVMTSGSWAAYNSSLGSPSPAITAASTSALLFTDNRGMCEACHQW